LFVLKKEKFRAYVTQVSIEGGNKDPYFDKQGVVNYNSNRFWEYKDFNKWTPGLERIFTLTLDTTNWIN